MGTNGIGEERGQGEVCGKVREDKDEREKEWCS